MAQIVTWAGAAFKLVTGSAVLYILYGAFANFFELAIELIYSPVDPDILELGAKVLFITFIIAELTLFLFVIFAAVRVEYDRYIEY